MPYKVFNSHANDYDAWYDSEPGKAIFAMEADCLKPLLYKHDRPYLEVGVGSGRFAEALGIEFGVEPATALMHMAESRGIKVTEAVGEELPFPDNTFGGVLIALTLCFITDPQQVLREVRRVLKPGGGVVLGLILRDSPWSEFYIAKGSRGHPLYSRARFFLKGEVGNLLKTAGFTALKYRSVLFQPPGQNNYHVESPVSGYRRSAGFVAIKAVLP